MIYKVHFEDISHIFDFELDLHTKNWNELLKIAKEHIRTLGGFPEKVTYMSMKRISRKKSKQIRFGFMRT